MNKAFSPLAASAQLSVTYRPVGELVPDHSLLFTWRRQARQGRLSGDSVPALVPVEITPVAAPISSDAPQPASSPPAQRARAGIIEIELGGGCRVRVDRDVDVEALQRVLELLRRR